MSILIGIIFIALIGYIFEQRRHIKFLKLVNYNQETRHIMTKHQRYLLDHQIETYKFLLDTLGYDRDAISEGNYTKHEPNPEKLQAIQAEFQQKERIYRSKNIQFETELEVREID